MSEEEKMNQGEWYDANYDAVLIKKREKAGSAKNFPIWNDH